MFIIPEKEALKVKQEDTYDTYMFLPIYSIVEKTGNKAKHGDTFFTNWMQHRCAI